MGLGPRRATPDMVAAANPPAGFEPILSNSPFGWENGPIFEKTDDSGKVRGFRVADRHINAGGACHGGMIMTFADILLATAVFVVAEPPFVTVRLTTDFIGPAFKGEWLEGRACVTGIDDGLVAVTGEMHAGDRAVASVSGLFKTIRPREGR
ncbi:PaaI family thioesterase [Kordiimonas lacus]|uniref:Acyl-coenzyme A thioesterase PaaI, contains HGG motif n=1 Tax=Kordiimonas lacus TaxID=637679 RepID=A0A1G6VMT2_9PROT|nr:PaaI family thioesterase [Kordiimonas lacus]SDD54185.1 Acyl-coenzyme A thioesterase PaaI, contains HGG motif [Kordiimonas lacus]